MTRVLLVGNPSAQSGDAGPRIALAQSAMTARGWTVDLLTTQPGGRTPALVKEAVERTRCDLVAYLGGDGTFSAVGKGILASGRPVPLGMLPAGTANDQGRSLGVSSEPQALEMNLDVMAAGHLTHLDVARLGRLDHGRVDAREEVFHSVGWGLQPEILSQRNQDQADVAQVPVLRDVFRDFAVYAGAALKQLAASYLEPTFFDATVVVDGRTTHLPGLTDIVVKNTPVYGGAWVFDRTALPDDGLFELVPIAGRRDMAATALESLLEGPLRPGDLHVLGEPSHGILRGAEMDLTLHRPDRPGVSSQVDGEEWVAGHHFRLSVLRGALAVLTPAGFRPSWRHG
jgi:diacylglycerol kinase (ATP)